MSTCIQKPLKFQLWANLMFQCVDNLFCVYIHRDPFWLSFYAYFNWFCHIWFAFCMGLHLFSEAGWMPYIVKDPEGLNSDQGIPLRGGTRIPRNNFFGKESIHEKISLYTLRTRILKLHNFQILITFTYIFEMPSLYHSAYNSVLVNMHIKSYL